MSTQSFDLAFDLSILDTLWDHVGLFSVTDVVNKSIYIRFKESIRETLLNNIKLPDDYLLKTLFGNLYYLFDHKDIDKSILKDIHYVFAVLSGQVFYTYYNEYYNDQIKLTTILHESEVESLKIPNVDNHVIHEFKWLDITIKVLNYKYGKTIEAGVNFRDFVSLKMPDKIID